VGRWAGGFVAGAIAAAAATTDLVAHRGDLDALSVTLYVAGGLFVAIPRIDRLTASLPIFGRSGVSLEINQEALATARESASLATEAAATAARAGALYAAWLAELEALDALDALDDGGDPLPLGLATFRFINTRLEDLSRWVGGDEEDVRAALWWCEPGGGARIVAAPRIRDPETLGYVFSPRVGILGRVLATGEPVELADATRDPEWRRIATAPPRYHGLLCLPISAEGRVIGVLSVDRERAERFGAESIRFAELVRSVIVLAARRSRGAAVSLPWPGVPRARPPVRDSR